MSSGKGLVGQISVCAWTSILYLALQAAKSLVEDTSQSCLDKKVACGVRQTPQLGKYAT